MSLSDIITGSEEMNSTTFLAVITAVAVIGAGCAIFFLGGMNDEITTVVAIEDGMTCTIDGKAVSNGEQIVIKEKSKLDVHVESADAVRIGAAGNWASEKNEYGKVFTTDSAAKKADFTFELNHGKFTGGLLVYNAIQTDDESCTLYLQFNFDESAATVSCGGTEIKNGEVFALNEQGTIDVDSKIGETIIDVDAMWSYSGGWTTHCYDTVVDDHYSFTLEGKKVFGDAHGYVNITLSES